MDKHELIQLLQECQAIQFGRFVLTSGAVSDYYIDIKKASSTPQVLQHIAQMIAPHTKRYDVLAGMELGAVPLVVAVALETEIPYTIIRKEKRDHGTSKQLEGTDVQGKKVCIIEDVTTSGGSVLHAINILRRHQAAVDKVISVVDRNGGAREKVEDVHITFVSLLTIEDILKEKGNDE